MRIDRPRTPKMNWAKKAAEKRGDTAPERDFSGHEVPENHKGLGSWREITLRSPGACLSCDIHLLTGNTALWNPTLSERGAIVCDRDCLEAWRKARTG